MPTLRSNTRARDFRIATSNLASAVAQLTTEDVRDDVSRASTPEYLTARKYEGEAANEKLERDRQAGVEADRSKGKGKARAVSEDRGERRESEEGEKVLLILETPRILNRGFRGKLREAMRRAMMGDSFDRI
jgi:hypothetical protein